MASESSYLVSAFAWIGSKIEISTVKSELKAYKSEIVFSVSNVSMIYHQNLIAV
jgi:hypothetical protein